MRCEVPELKRCCFCFPLRRGLILWAYLKLAIGLAAMCYFTIGFVFLMSIVVMNDFRDFIIEMLIFIIIIPAMVIDNVIYIVFIVSLHKKHYRIMRAYYMYLLVILGITTVLSLLLLGYQLYLDELVFVFYYPHYTTLFTQSVIAFVHIVLQAYLILLVKSELRKLSDMWQFQFHNNAAEAECVMTSTVGYEFTRAIPTESNGASIDKEYDWTVYTNESSSKNIEPS